MTSETGKIHLPNGKQTYEADLWMVVGPSGVTSVPNPYKQSPIKGWRERAGLAENYSVHSPSAVEAAMLEEIAELRAAIATDRTEELAATVDKLLAHCPDGECMTCGEIICPHNEPLHFHHDGCPACAEVGA